MIRFLARSFLCAAWTLSLTASAAIASAPPTDEHVKGAVDTYQKNWADLFERGSATRESVEELRSHALDGLDAAELTPKQVGMLLRAKMLHGDATRAAIADHLTALKDDKTKVGATARVLRLYFEGGVTDPNNRPDPELQDKLLGEVFAHGALSAAVRSGDASIVIEALNSLAKKSVWHAYREEIYGLKDDLLQCADHRIAYDFESYFEILGYLNEESSTEKDEARRQAIRADMVAYGRNVLERAADGAIDMSEPYVEYLTDAMARMDSAHARGEFIGSEAPALDFIWSNDESLGSLAALRGQVVILDFWATWCGPCVASIPNVRELQKRYSGFPVKIIGVTSIQGAHHAEGGSVDCKDDPEKEMNLMAEYISQKDITWTIAFAKQAVYNPDYGVRGIPHMMIIAPDGTVRYNNLHPADPLAEKAAKIDGLLKEFDLPTPSPVPAEDEADTK